MKTLIRNGLVFDGEDFLSSNTEVLIDGGVIVAVGPGLGLDSSDANVLDAGGATVLPGLIDCHVHLSFGSEPQLVALLGAMNDAQLAVRALAHAQAALRAGITSVRDLGGVRNIELTVRDEIAAGRWPGPTIRCSGRMICITGGHGWFVGIEADGPDEVRRAVRTNLKAGADLIKLMATGGVMTPRIDPLTSHFGEAEMEAALDEAGNFGRKVACHALGAEGILRAVRAGASSIEHGFDLPDEVITAMVAAGVVLVPTLSAMGVVERVGYEGLPPDLARRAASFIEMQRVSVRRFHRAGGRIAMGTDAGTPLNFHGHNAQELEFLCELGLSIEDALRAATSIAADLCDLSDRGRLSAGHAADLVIVDGDLRRGLAPLTHRQGVRMVLKDGRQVDRDLPTANHQEPLAFASTPF
jgi:imidazolonepropionase-like amidohydrolase